PRRDYKVVIGSVVSSVGLSRRCHRVKINGKAVAEITSGRQLEINFGVEDDLSQRLMIAGGEGGIFVLVTLPNRMQSGHVIKFLEDGNEPSNLHCIRRHVGFFGLELEVRRSVKEQG